MACQTPGLSIDEYLDSEYHSKVSMYLGVVRDNDTDDFLAWKLGRIAMKASHVLSLNFHLSSFSGYDFYVKYHSEM